MSKKEEKVEEVDAPEAVEEVDETEAEETEEVVVPEEVEDDSDAIVKSIDALRTTVEERLETNKSETQSLIEELTKKIDSNNEEFLRKAADIESKYDQLSSKLATTAEKMAGLEGSLAKMNKSAAIRKSSDIETEEKEVQNNDTWNGAFSVNNLWS